MTPLIRPAAFALVATAACSPVSLAWAQQTLPEIVVTETDENQAAERAFREAVSSTQISSRTLEEVEPRDLHDLSSLVPNLSAFDTGGQRMTNLTMRGNRELTYQYGPGLQPSIAYYLDDVPSLNALARSSNLPALASARVLRGPQGFTHGASGPGGLIELTTLDGEPKPSAMLEVGVGNHGTRYATASLRGAAGPDDILRVAIDAQADDRDGYYDNVATGTDYGKKRGTQVRAKIGLRPQGNRFEADLILEAQRFRDQSDPFLSNIGSNPPAEVDYAYEGYEDINNDLFALRLKWREQDHELLSVTSLRNTTWAFSNDSGVYPMPDLVRLEGYTRDKERAITQEFRLSRLSDGDRIGYTAGAFFADRTLDVAAGMLIYPQIPIPGMALRESHSKLRDLALFGELAIPLATHWEAGLGLRYERNYRKAHNNYTAPLITDGKKTFNTFLPRVTLSHTPNEHVNWFVGYSKGLRPGDLNSDGSLVDPSIYIIEPQRSNHFELGLKTRELVPGLTLSGAVYWSDYRNYHNFTSYPSALGVRNVGVTVAKRARVQGGELEAAYDLGSGWQAFGSLGLTHARFREFDLNGRNLDGSTISFVPKMTGSLGMSWEHGPYSARAEMQRIGRYYYDEANTGTQSGFTLVHLAARWKFSKHASAGIVVRNLFDKRYVSYAYDTTGSGNALGGYGEPRLVTFNLRFEL